MTALCHGILLNGTSSSGKSSIAAAIAEVSESPFVHLELDTFLGMIAFRHIDCEPIDGVNAICEKLVLGFHRAIEGMIETGNLVLVDHVLQEETWRRSMNKILQKTPLLRVRVTCPKDELVRRELARGDRPGGLALIQVDRVYRDIAYDLTVVTSELSPPECAMLILEQFALHSRNR